MNEEMIERSQEVADLLKTLGHPKRLLILCSLSDGEKSVGALEQICKASQSQVSQFLKRMESDGHIQSRRESNYVYYSIANEKVGELIKNLNNIFCSN